MDGIPVGNLRPMGTRTKRLWGYGAAAAMSLITLGVFARLQDYGPESAIRRFHVDLMNDNAGDLRQVTTQRLDSKNVYWLEKQVSSALLSNARYQIAQMDRTPDEVRAVLVYEFPNSPVQEFLVWVVDRSGRSWRVDADKMRTIADSFGPR